MQSTSANHGQRSSMTGADKWKYNFHPLPYRMAQEMEDPEEIIQMEKSPNGQDHERNELANSPQTKRHVAPYNSGSHHYILDSTGKPGEENRNYNPQCGQRKETRQRYLTGTQELYSDEYEEEDYDLPYQNGRNSKYHGQNNRKLEKTENRIHWLIAQIDLRNSEIASLQEELQRELELKHNTFIGEA